MKAYDRLDQWFLCEFLKILGFNEHFIMLIMGLVCSGTTKVHSNGLFIEEILLGRGVR